MTCPVQSSTVTAPDGVAIAVDRYGDAGRRSALVICPGFFKSKQTATFQRLARALADGGAYDALCMDFRGHGSSGGRYCFSAKEGADLEAVLAFARARYAHLGLLGFSLGAAIAINTASRHPEGIRSLIAVSAPCVFGEIEFKWWTPEAIRRGIQGLEPGAGCRPGNLFLKKDRPVERVAQLSPIPALFIHGTGDVIVDARHSRHLYAAASEPKRLELINGGSHAEALFRDEPQRFLGLVTGWLAKTLPAD